MKRQYPAIDIAKYVSALLVLAIHTYPFVDISPVFNTFFLQTICRLAVPFFFISSAFFFFGHYQSKSLEDTRPLQRYLWRIFRLYLVWTVIYLPYTIWNYMDSGFGWYNIISYLRDFLLNGSYYHLWFLPALLLGMCLVYAGLRFLGDVKTTIIALVLYILGYFINVYAAVWQSVPYVSIVYGFFTKTLVTSRDGIFFAPIYLLMGYWVLKGFRIRRQPALIGFAASLILLILEVSVYYFLGILEDTSSMFLMLLPCSYFLFCWLLSLKMPWHPQYKILRTDSTVIYVSQILFARIFLILMPQAHLAVYLFTLACCQLLSACIVRYSERLPILKYLV